MKPIRLLIAVVLLGGLVGAYFWSEKHEADKAKKPAEGAAPRILDLKVADIMGLEIKKRGGEDTILTRTDSGVWSVTSPKPFPADQGAVGGVTAAGSTLFSNRVIDDNVTDLASYGLAPAAMQVDFKMKDGKTVTLLVGDANPAGNSVYAKVATDPHLYTMDSSSKTAFDKETKDLRDKRLLTFDQEKATRVELTAKKETIEFGRINQTDWQILKPKPLRADGFAVEELVRKLKEANMDLSVAEDDAKKAAASFSAATPVATVKFTDPGGMQSIEIRKVKDDYYAKSSVVDGVHKVSKDLGTGVDKSLDDFRNKEGLRLRLQRPHKNRFQGRPEIHVLFQVRRQVDGQRQNHGFDHDSGSDRQAPRSIRRQVHRNRFHHAASGNHGCLPRRQAHGEGSDRAR